MQRLAGIMLVAFVCVAMLSGCALRDPRADYAYSRASDGLWGDTSFELIDWNFPTSLNQPPVEAARAHPARTHRHRRHVGDAQPIAALGQPRPGRRAADARPALG